MGVAKVVDEASGNVAIVAHFLPVGNWGYETSFLHNVFKPVRECCKFYSNT